MKILEFPVLLQLLFPKETDELEKLPVAKTFPILSEEIPSPASLLIPPSDFAHRTFPKPSYFTTKISVLPLLVMVVLPKLIELLKKEPVTKIFPPVSAETLYPISSEVPPSDFAHNKLPDASYFATKIAALPVFVKVVLPKVMEELRK